MGMSKRCLCCWWRHSMVFTSRIAFMAGLRRTGLPTSARYDMLFYGTARSKIRESPKIVIYDSRRQRRAQFWQNHRVDLLSSAWSSCSACCLNDCRDWSVPGIESSTFIVSLLVALPIRLIVIIINTSIFIAEVALFKRLSWRFQYR